MNDARRRWIAYTSAAAVVGALVYWGFVRETEADLGTLVSSAQLHASLAAAIPESAPGAEARELRSKLLADADAWLDRAEASEPGRSITTEVRAYVASLRGDSDTAAALYRRARESSDCALESVAALVVNEARAHLAGRQPERAAATIAAHIARLDGRDRTLALTVQALALERANRRSEARDVLAVLVASAGTGDPACLGASELLEQIGDWAGAEIALRKAGVDGPTTTYRLARLKLRSQDLDRALDLLEDSITGDAKIRTLVRSDQALWSVCSGDERFDGLMSSADASASPAAGR